MGRRRPTTGDCCAARRGRPASRVSARSQTEIPLSRIAARVSGSMKAPPPVASTCGGRAKQPGDHPALAVAKRRFAVDFENVRDRASRSVFDLLVGIHERHSDPAGESAADRALACSHQAHEDDRAIDSWAPCPCRHGFSDALRPTGPRVVEAPRLAPIDCHTVAIIRVYHTSVECLPADSGSTRGQK